MKSIFEQKREFEFISLFDYCYYFKLQLRYIRFYVQYRNILTFSHNKKLKLFLRNHFTRLKQCSLSML